MNKKSFLSFVVDFFFIRNIASLLLQPYSNKENRLFLFFSMKKVIRFQSVFKVGNNYLTNN